MEVKQAVKILRAHNNWRKGLASDLIIKPTDIGLAIDTVCNVLDPPADMTAAELSQFLDEIHQRHDGDKD